MLFNSYVNKNLLEMQMVESVWTVIPALILAQIALPSLLLLYMLDESVDRTLTIKAVGHQWYWSYEYSDFWHRGATSNLEFDSYMLPPTDLSANIFRLLDTDNHTVAPLKTNIRLLVSSADVLHAWTVPAMGVKADAVPGRINQIKFSPQRPGLFFGQCSEICGANHRFMPIVLEVVGGGAFLEWVLNFS
jgi:cytochrome c oxidase subunit 2